MSMVQRSVHRLTTTFLLVVSLLFSQLALANYVCPPGAEAATMVSDMPSGEPCESMALAAGEAMDEEQPVLCHQHCLNAPQSFEAQAPVVSLPAVVQVLLVPLLTDAGARRSVAFAHAGRERPPPAPLFLSTLRFRV
jgi:hypothetical protein